MIVKVKKRKLKWWWKERGGKKWETKDPFILPNGSMSTFPRCSVTVPHFWNWTYHSPSPHRRIPICPFPQVFPFVPHLPRIHFKLRFENDRFLLDETTWSLVPASYRPSTNDVVCMLYPRLRRLPRSLPFKVGSSADGPGRTELGTSAPLFCKWYVSVETQMASTAKVDECETHSSSWYNRWSLSSLPTNPPLKT
jgi:hypothetical protein